MKPDTPGAVLRWLRIVPFCAAILGAIALAVHNCGWSVLAWFPGLPLGGVLLIWSGMGLFEIELRNRPLGRGPEGK